MREPVQLLAPRAGDAGDRAARAAGVGLWEWDLEGDEVWCSEGLAEILGRPHADGAAGRALWSAAIHPADRAHALRDLGAMVGDGRRRSSTYRVVRPDGEVRWVLSQGRAVRCCDGRPVRLAGAVVDVTDDPAAATRLAASVTSMGDGHVAVDRAWRITHANAAISALLGAEVVGAGFFSRLSEAVDPQLASDCRQALTGGSTGAFECFAAALGRWYEIEAHPLAGGLLISFRDVTARHEAARERARLLAAERVATRSAERARAELEHAATHDALTGLANRAALMTWLGTALERSRAGDGALALCFLDLDRLKGINDSLGHLEGDRVLVEVGRRLREVVRSGDLVARIGGDEFVLATVGLPRPAVEDVARRALEGVTAPIEVGGRRLRVTTSVGIAFGGPSATAETVLRDADAALYRAKAAGGDRFAVFDESVRATTAARRALERELRGAVADGGLRVWYQPCFDLRTGRCTGAEALVRWQHPERGLLLPPDFLPVAAQSDLVVRLGEWVLTTVGHDVARWRRHRGGGPRTTWVNVSARELDHPAFPDLVATVLDRTGLAAGALGVEVTEAALASHPATADRTLEVLRAMGVPVAIDDFGTGPSSLARLAAAPVRALRIDRSLVAGADVAEGTPLLRALVEVAHAIGATAGAEGVETERQLTALRALGLDEVSGNLLSPPVPVERLPAAVAAGLAALRRLAAADGLTC